MSASTNTLHLLLPGLLGPLSNLKTDAHKLRLPALERLLVRADVHPYPGQDYTSTLFSLFGYPLRADQDLPEGAVSMLAETGEAGDYCWMRADPVHLKADRDRLLLFNSDQLKIEQVEAEAVAQAFNQHFAEEKLQLFTPNPERWYLRLERCPELITHPLHLVSGRHIEPFMPRGAEAARWRQLSNEMQMLLFQLPLNQQRETQGMLSINGIWLSGIGQLPGSSAVNLDGVFTDDSVAQGLAGLNQVTCFPLSDADLANPGSWQRLLMINMRLLPTIANADPDAWSELLHDVDEQLQPLISGLKRNPTACLLIYPCHGQIYHSTAATLRRFWRRGRPITHYLEQAERLQ